MKFHDFKLLDPPVQAHIICQKGVYLGERSEDDFFVALYRVHDFYVEVYCRFSNNEIVKFISFHSEVLLEPYLNRISIHGLLRDVFPQIK
jgi:hypothetical protein